MTRKHSLASVVVAGVLSALTLGAASSASATIIKYAAVLDGASEAPPNGSLGSGTVIAAYDDFAHTLLLDVAFAGLTGTVTAAHIHCCTTVPGVGTAGVATTTPTFAGFPSGVTSGGYHNLLDLTLSSSYRTGFITDNGGTTATAEAALASGLAAGKAYLNIHTTFVPGGEIRGFLEVPEPASMALFGLGLLGLAASRRRIRLHG